MCAAMAITQYGCGKKSTDSSKQSPSVSSQGNSSDEHQQDASNQKGIVCVWDGVPIRETPTKNGKFISSINLGETISDLDKSEKDATDKNREYFKVRLSDGKEGWAPTYGLIKNASVGAIKTDASLYKRPDLLTITPIKLVPMEFVAIISEKDDWIEIANEQKKKTGWIKKDAVTTNKEDITTSILINKKMAINDGSSVTEKYTALIAQAPYPNSIFIENLKKQLAAQSSPVTPIPASENMTQDNPAPSANTATTDNAAAPSSTPVNQNTSSGN